MIIVVASIEVKAGRLAEFIDIFKANVPHVLEEQGCIEYVPTIDVPTGLKTQACNDNVVTIVEKWRDADALQAHMETAHMLAYKERVQDLVENVALKILKEA